MADSPLAVPSHDAEPVPRGPIGNLASQQDGADPLPLPNGETAESTGGPEAPDSAGGTGSVATFRRLDGSLAFWVWGALVLVILVVFRETSLSFVSTWSRSSMFGHGFLIVPLCIYLLWTRRKPLAAARPRPNPWAFALFAGAVLVWMTGKLTDTVLVKQLALVVMVQLSFLAVLGTRLTKAAAFPLLFLFFAVPFGESAIPPLQDLTARLVVNLLRATGMPVYLDGVFIHIPSGRFHVAEACAGARYLLTSITLGVLMASLFYKAIWRRALIVSLSIAVPVVANGIRAYGIVMIAHLTDYKVAIGVDHVLYGAVFLGFVTICLLALGMTFREHASDESGAAPVQAAPAAPVRLPASVVLASLAVLLVAFSARGLDAHLSDRISGVGSAQLPRLTVSAPWIETQSASLDWQPDIPGSDAQSVQTFTDGTRSIALSISLFTHQRPGAEAVTEGNDLGGSEAWSKAALGKSRIQVDGRALDVIKVRFVSPRTERLVWYWYWIDGRFTANPYLAKLLEVKAKLFGGLQSAAVVALSMEVTDDLTAPETHLRGFLEQLSPIGAALDADSRSFPRTSRGEPAGLGAHSSVDFS